MAQWGLAGAGELRVGWGWGQGQLLPQSLGCSYRASALSSLQTPPAKLVFSKATYHLNHLSIP